MNVELDITFQTAKSLSHTTNGNIHMKNITGPGQRRVLA
jgi:hypothetical protein